MQADGIVKKFNWYPGIDAQYVKPKLDDATWNKLFVDITPDDLATKGKPFPIAPYNNAILEAYETVGQVSSIAPCRKRRGAPFSFPKVNRCPNACSVCCSCCLRWR